MGELMRIIGDPGVIVRQDARVFELLGKHFFTSAGPAHYPTGPCSCRTCRAGREALREAEDA